MSEQTAFYTSWQLAEGRHRRETLERFWLLKRQGVSRGEALELVGTSDSTLRDWAKLYERASDWNDLIPKVSTGRRSALAALEAQVGPEVLAETIAKVKASNLETGKNRFAWRVCTASTEEVPQVVKDVVRDPARRSKQYIPRSLINATHVTKAHRMAFRSPRDLTLNGGYIPRTMDVLPGDIYVIDDYTPTFGWYVPWPRSKDYPFGVKLLQGQLLRIVDYASLYCPGYALVAREKSSYRASDIWSFYGDIFRTVGLPRLGFQHEGGVFQANALRGVPVEYEEGEVDQGRRVGALTTLPSNVLPWHRAKVPDHTFSARLEVYRSILPKSKPIELAFSIASKLEGSIWGYLGSDQRTKAHAKAKSTFEACRRGTLDPRLHFLSATEVMARLDNQIAFIHEEPMEGRVRRGRPQDLWHETVAEHPLLWLPEHLRFLYKPNWAVKTINNMVVDMSYRDRDTGERFTLFYVNEEAFADLREKKVLVYHDRLNPEEPAEIATLDGKYLCTAKPWSGTGAFIDRNSEGFKIQARYFGSLMRATSIIAQHATSRQLPPEIAARRLRAAAERREEERTPFSPSRAASCPATAPKPVPATASQDRRDAGAEPAQTQPATSAYRVKSWRERVFGDETEEEATNHSHPPRGGQRQTPLGSSQAGSIKTAE